MWRGFWNFTTDMVSSPGAHRFTSGPLSHVKAQSYVLGPISFISVTWILTTSESLLPLALLTQSETGGRIFKVGAKFDKYPPYYNHPAGKGSMFNIARLQPAKQRKDMYSSYFSRAAIQRVESLILSQVKTFLDVLEKSSKEQTAVDLTFGYRCLTADIIMNYCYQKPLGALDAPDFKYPLIVVLRESLSAQMWVSYFSATFNSVFDIASKLPRTVAQKWMPPLAAMRKMQDVGYVFRGMCVMAG